MRGHIGLRDNRRKDDEEIHRGQSKSKGGEQCTRRIPSAPQCRRRHEPPSNKDRLQDGPDQTGRAGAK